MQGEGGATLTGGWGRDPLPGPSLPPGCPPPIRAPLSSALLSAGPLPANPSARLMAALRPPLREAVWGGAQGAPPGGGGRGGPRPSAPGAGGKRGRGPGPPLSPSEGRPRGPPVGSRRRGAPRPQPLSLSELCPQSRASARYWPKHEEMHPKMPPRGSLRAEVSSRFIAQSSTPTWALVAQ